MAAIASTDRLRRQNSLLVMQSLRKGAALSHTDIAEQTGLASATVSAITADLLAGDYVAKLEQAPAQGRGRPRVLFQPSASRGYIAVVILSSDSASFSLLDFSGKLLDRFMEKRNATAEQHALLGFIEQGILRLQQRAHLSNSDLLHIALSSKGVVDQHSGQMLWSPIIRDTPVDLRGYLSAAFGCQVAVYNETALVAQALWRAQKPFAQQQAGDTLVTVSLGHNIGLGLARGQGPTSAEPEIIAPNFGHMLHVPDGAQCRCGARGCVEAYSGFYAILRSAFEVPEKTVPANFVPLDEVDKIANLARHHDRRAAFAFRQAGLAIGNGLSRLSSLYGGMSVFISGPGTRYYDLIEAGLKDGLRQSSLSRFGVLPTIEVVLSEVELISEGHRSLALANCDAQLLSED